MSDPLDPKRASIRSALFGGRGRVAVWDLGARTPPFTAVLWCELEPGGSVGIHKQDTDDEVVVVIDGTGVLSVDRVPQVCIPGSAVPLPLGKLLEIENSSDSESLRYLIIKARA